MGGALIPVPVGELFARVAALIAPTGHAPARVGNVELHAHQRSAVTRIEAAMREFGGALLADETGLGKTHVAIAVARTAERPLVVAPSALRDMWRAACSTAGIDIPFISIESLSRRPAAPSLTPDLVIVDEAHHARNPATARYRALAALTTGAQVLLVSATPVHNSTRDLSTLLALFLGARASALDPSCTSRCVIRRGVVDAPRGAVPRIDARGVLHVDHDHRLLDLMLALPPPIPPVDGGDGGVLLVYSLLRQWASTQGALVEALRRRLARATALLAGLDAGRHPSINELSAWSFADGAIQLAFPELMIADEHVSVPEAGLTACVSAHAAAVRSLLEVIRRRPDPDVQRAAHLRALRSRHPGSRIVVFTQYATSVSAMFGLLRAEPGVAALTADGGRVAGGALTRSETLERFAPHAQRAANVGRAHRIDLLLTTDLLSEGVNLQDADVLVHLDLPWTPARLEQRIGRIARLGSRHRSVSVYTMCPPASTERIVRVEQRLREKLRISTRSVGVVGTILPSLSPPGSAVGASDDHWGDTSAAPDSPARVREGILSILSRWRASTTRTGPDIAPVVAALDATFDGFIAVIGDPAQPMVIADIGHGATDDPAVVLAALRAANAAHAFRHAQPALVPERSTGAAEPTPIDSRALTRALAAIARWRSANRIRRDLSVDGALQARSRRSVVDRIAAIARRAPRHMRPAITALAATARRTAITRYGVGAERVLGELAAASMPDEAWLRAVTTFGALHGAETAPEPAAQDAVLALLLLGNGCPRDPVAIDQV